MMTNKTFTLAMGVIGWAGFQSVAIAQTITIPTAEFAAFVGTLTNAGAASGGANTIANVPVTTAYVLGTVVDVLTADVTNIAAGSWQNEPSIRLENDAFPGLSTYFNFQDGNLTYASFSIASLTTRVFGASTTWGWGSAPTLSAGSAIPNGSNWTVECFEGYDDDNLGADSSGTNISFTLPGTEPPPPPPPISTINLPGTVNFAAAVGDVDNSVFTGLSPITTAGYIGTGVAVQSCDLTALIAGTWGTEARISLQNSAFPGQAYTFQLGTVNGYTTLSIGPNAVRPWITTGGIGAILPVASTWSVECFESLSDGPGVDATGDNVAFDITSGSPPPPPGPGDNPTVAIDLGTVSSSNPLAATVATLSAGAAKWYKFNVGNVDGNVGDWLSIWTATTADDTHIGLYDNTGNAITNDDDDGDGVLSYILIGAGGDPGGPVYGGASVDPFQTAAGTYYLAVGEFFATFSNNFGFTSTGLGATGIDLNITTSVGGGGGQFLTGNLDLNDTLFSVFGLTRSIGYSVKVGVTEVASGTITASSASSALNINVGASTGSATVTFSGGSFLTRVVPVTLTGSSQSLGTVAMNNGDADDTGEVDASDIDNVIANFGQLWPGGVGNPLADLNVSGEVDAVDIDIAIANFGNLDE